MIETPQIEEVMALALRLSLGDRLQLVEQITASVKHDIESPTRDQNPPSEDESWGKSLRTFIESTDFSGWSSIDQDDPVEWVNQVRREQRIARGLKWGNEE